MSNNMKLISALMLASSFLLSGCQILNGFKVRGVETYREPTGQVKVSRVRFIGNITGTGIKAAGSEYYDSLVYDGIFGTYNSTKDSGMPKISYRKTDYKGYYYEVKVKSGPARFIIKTDPTFRGSCVMQFEINLVANKDYDVNFNAGESRESCRLHVNEIVRDESTGVFILKPTEVKALYK